MTALLIYLIGCVVAYLMYKYLVKEKGLFDLTLYTALFSWVGVFAIIIVIMTESNWGDRPAKW